jgi:hypothetical protein
VYTLVVVVLYDTNSNQSFCDSLCCTVIAAIMLSLHKYALSDCAAVANVGCHICTCQLASHVLYICDTQKFLSTVNPEVSSAFQMMANCGWI